MFPVYLLSISLLLILLHLHLLIYLVSSYSRGLFTFEESTLPQDEHEEDKEEESSDYCTDYYPEEVLTCDLTGCFVMLTIYKERENKN